MPGRPGPSRGKVQTMPSSRMIRRRIRRRRLSALGLMVTLLAAGVGAALALGDTDATSAKRVVAHRGVHRPHGASGTRAHPTALNVYAHTRAGMLTSVTRRARYLIYVPDSAGDGVYVINPRTYKVIDYFQ